MTPPGLDEGRVRLDKWLWAARFFKTRSAATEAVQGGRVHLNGARAKPARDVRTGDMIEVTVGEATFHVEVTGLADRRGSAAQAALLYRETTESRERRERLREQRRMAAPLGSDLVGGRPEKRDRRRLDALRGGGRGRGGAPTGRPPRSGRDDDRG
ncbi:MAG: RNA-binding S4 domain-containing protein [Miltoncostaeaceae bacterium]